MTVFYSIYNSQLQRESGAGERESRVRLEGERSPEVEVPMWEIIRGKPTIVPDLPFRGSYTTSNSNGGGNSCHLG